MKGLGPICVVAALMAASACSREARTLGPTPPQSPPNGAADPRIAAYLGNVYQLGQGGTYFVTYGCGGCHDSAAPDLRAAKLPVGRTFDLIYQAIADRHGALAYRQRVPAEQLWQLTAYVADLPAHTPDKRHRQAVDQQGEPAGTAWPGPLR